MRIILILAIFVVLSHARPRSRNGSKGSKMESFAALMRALYNKNALTRELDNEKVSTREVALSSDWSACGSYTRLSASSGEIISPGFGDGDYAKNLDVCWKITAHPNQIVKLTLDFLEIEDFHICGKYDFLDIRGVGNQTLCGTHTGEQYDFSLQNELRLHFHSDGTTNRKGFKISYQIQDMPNQDACSAGVTHTESKGTIAYSKDNTGVVDCHWTIKAPTGQKIKMQFKSFALISTPTCNIDWLEIYDGPQVTKAGVKQMGSWYDTAWWGGNGVNMVARPCGTNTPNDITSTHSQMELVYKNTQSCCTTTGFELTYYFVAA